MDTASPPVSPSVVARIFMIQKTRVTSGTLLRTSLFSMLIAPCQSNRVTPSPASQLARAGLNTARTSGLRFQIRLEQPIDAFVFVEPGIGIGETVAIQRIRRNGEI